METQEKDEKKKPGRPSELKELKIKLASLLERVDKQNDVISHLAKNNPVSIRKAYETEENETGNMGPRTMQATGPAEMSLSPPEFKTVDRYCPEKMALLAFMEEYLIVEVADTTDEMCVPIPSVFNDGKSQFFIRGEEQKVKRKFVEVLSRCKKTTFTQRKEINFNGDQVYINVPHTALTYPFRILEDPSGISPGSKGHEWLKSIQMEA